MISLLPPLRTDLPPTAETALGAVNRFLDCLVELRRVDWLAIGLDLMGDRGGLGVRQRAWVEVEAEIDAHRLGLAAWQVRDALETAAFLVSRTWWSWTGNERRACAATQGAAEAAALALLVQAHVQSDAVRILCAPFSRFIDCQLFSPML